MKKLLGIVVLGLFLCSTFFINSSYSDSKAELKIKHGSIGYGAEALDYNFECLIDRESYEESLYNRLVERMGPYKFGYKMYQHPKGNLMLHNPWKDNDLFYGGAIASVYKAKDSENLRLVTPTIPNDRTLVFYDLQFKSDKIMLYRYSYKLNAPVGNKKKKKKVRYGELLTNDTHDNALEILEDLKFDMLEYIFKGPEFEISVIYSCKKW